MTINSVGSSAFDLVSYWRGLTKDQKTSMASSVGSSVGYLRQVFLYGKEPGAKMAVNLGAHCSLPPAAFRPDIFGEHLGEDAA
jgi:hypothetical protein